MRFCPCISVVSLLVAVLGCTGSDRKDGSKNSQPRTVAIVKFATHPALDDTEVGLVEVIERARAASSSFKDLQIEKHNANGNPQLAKQLAERVTRQDVKLIIAIATPAAQAVVRTPSSIPLIYAAVADPEGAGILESGRATGIKNAGENIIAKALAFIRNVFPRAKRLGTIFNPSEQNSVYVQAILTRLAPKHGFQLVQIEVLDKSQVASSVEVLSKKVEIIYSANDNTVNAAAAGVVAVTRSTKTPFVIGDLSTAAGALAAVGLEYRSMGNEVGEMAIQLLGGKSVKNLPPREPPAPKIWVDQSTLKVLGLELPPEARKRVDKFL